MDMVVAQAIITPTHLLVVHARMGHGTWIAAMPLPDASVTTDSVLSVSHTVRTRWIWNLKLLRSEPSRFILLDIRSDELDDSGDTMQFLEWHLEDDGSIRVAVLHSKRIEVSVNPQVNGLEVTRLPNISSLYLAVGREAGIDARGVLFEGGLAWAIRVTSCDDASEPPVRVEVCKGPLVDARPTWLRTSFDGCRGRLIHSLSGDMEDSIAILDFT